MATKKTEDDARDDEGKAPTVTESQSSSSSSTSRKMPKLQKNAQAESQSSSLTSRKMPKLQLLLMIVTGACFVVNALVSLQHATTDGMIGHNRAIHDAVEEFKNGFASSIAKKAKAKGSFGSNSEKVVGDALPDALLVRQHDDSNKAVADKNKDLSSSGERGNNNNNNNRKKSHSRQESKIAKLTCEEYGGPTDEFAQEMVYWSDIPSDALYVSPFRQKIRQTAGVRQYMTFEPDGGGWNNIRMAMETVVGLAIATGRTLVLPPQKKMYLLGNSRGKQRAHFDFEDFFPMHQMAEENDALEMITMKEFLETEAMTGKLLDKETGRPSFPPKNRTDWNMINQQEYDELREWLRTVALVPMWRPGQCLASFPSKGNHKSIEELRAMQTAIHKEGANSDIYIGHPVQVDSDPLDRMKENLAGRRDLCVYNETMQKELVVHFACYHKMKLRLLVHFYAFLFMEDWKEDLWMKRFMRDHMRYNDEIQCAAARVVQAMRKIARDRDPTGNPDGQFDSFHIRRGDFQFKKTRIGAAEIYKNSKDQLKPNSTIFVATDERDKKFFDYMKMHYDVHFLDDFMDKLKGVNSNYFGMIDQLVASRGQTFFGCWFSTFTGFITRIRGYRSVKDKLPGYEGGVLPSTFYYAVPKMKFEMTEYHPMRAGFFHREYPTSWRDIDRGIDELDLTQEQ